MTDDWAEFGRTGTTPEGNSGGGRNAVFAHFLSAIDPLPLYITGVLHTTRSAPLTVAVVVNGNVAAVTQSYQERGGHLFGTLVPETALRDGSNTVAAVAIQDSAAPPVPAPR